jgi:REP element-mobilizing transposase RayT
LYSGEIEFLNVSDSDNILAYSRYDSNNEIITIINASNEMIKLEVSIKQQSYYVDMINKHTHSPVEDKIHLEVNPRTAIILKSSRL